MLVENKHKIIDLKIITFNFQVYYVQIWERKPTVGLRPGMKKKYKTILIKISWRYQNLV